MSSVHYEAIMRSSIKELQSGKHGTSEALPSVMEISDSFPFLDSIMNLELFSNKMNPTISSWLKEILNFSLIRGLIDSLLNIEPLELKSSYRIGFTYDERMCLHDGSTRLEKPARIRSIYKLLVTEGLLERCDSIPTREITQDELSLVHNTEYCKLISKINDMTRTQIARLALRFNTIYISPHTPMAARLSAGSTLALVEAVASQTIKHGFAIVRPPGHHAEPDSAMGFCFFNNVALAAALAINSLGMKRVLILDWDVHHGNGTQRTFFKNSKVLYISIHRYENAKFYPHSTDASPEMVGAEDGEGRTINIAWNSIGVGDADYLTAFYKIILPCAKEFAPALILISAGFDAAKGDPVGMCNITPNGYGIMTQLLLNHLPQSSIIAALEGGYNLKAISASMTHVVRVLLGEKQECPDPEILRPTTIAKRAIKKTIKAHTKYWKCFSDQKKEHSRTKNTRFRAKF